MIKKLFVILLLFFSAFFFNASVVKGDDADQLTDKINQYIQKLNELGTAKNTLANQIKIIDSQVELTSLKITQTQNSIKTLETEIADLTVEIDKLENQINDLSEVFIHQIIQNYKLQKRIPSFAYLFSSNLNNFLEQYNYISTIQKNSQNSLLSMETVRTTYDMEKTAKTQKQQEMEELKKTLASQQNSLNIQKSQKSSLLEVTRNDEKRYQQLLAEAQSQLAALKSFSQSQGSSCLSSSPGGGSDGLFYSQRDPRWCNQRIGYSSDTIGEVGCYISSVSMLYKKLGVDVNPSTYAANPSNFFSTSAWMLDPVPPSGYTYKKVYYSTSVIDSELNAGRFVIAQMRAGNSAGMHFIVIRSGSNGNYNIHDPWFGADQNFSDRYSPSSVISLRLFTK